MAKYVNRTLKTSVDITNVHKFWNKQVNKFDELSTWQLVINKRFRKTCGMTYFDRNVIAISHFLLDFPEELYDTILHEIAHVLTYSQYGNTIKYTNDGHPKEWEEICKKIGARPSKYSDNPYVMSKNEMKKIVSKSVCSKCGDVRLSRLELWRYDKCFSKCRCGSERYTIYKKDNNNKFEFILNM